MYVKQLELATVIIKSTYKRVSKYIVLCAAISVTDVPAKTATGTIAIQVKDFNDHCPVLSHQSQTLCYEDHVVYVTAVDKDQFPNGAPFGFKVDTIFTKESWSIETLNGN